MNEITFIRFISLIGAIGMTAAALSEGFGDDPFIVSVDPNDARVAFSAWDYAKERCEAIIAGLPAAA